MSSVTLKATTCAAGNHVTLSLDGDAKLSHTFERSELAGPMTDREKSVLLIALFKLTNAGRTGVQAISLLRTGVTVTI